MVMKVEWSKHALKEIRRIFSWLESEAGGKTARRIVKALYNHADILATNPRIGQREELLDGLPVEFRRLVDGNYKIVYTIDGTIVVIVDVWDCRRNPSALRRRVLRRKP